MKSLLLLSVLFMSAPPALDGQNFQVTVGEKGKALDTPHVLSFTKGMMASPECAAWGFAPGRYQTRVLEAGIEFEVTLTSKTEGTLAWKGRIVGERIEGTSVWRKSGQAPIHYRFEGVKTSP